MVERGSATREKTGYSAAWLFYSARAAIAVAAKDRICCTCSSGYQLIGSVVYFVVRRSSCRSIMLRQEELAFFKAISTLQLSPAILKELRMALSRRKKKAAVPAGSRSTAPGETAFRPPRPGPNQGPPSHPHLIVSVARGPEVFKVRSITELCGLRVSVESYVAPKGPLQCKRCQRFEHTQRNCGYAPRCAACGGAHFTGGYSNPRGQPQCCGCGGNHTVSYRGCIKWKEAMAALAKRAPEGVRKCAATSHSAAPKAQRAGPSAEQTGGVLSRPPPLLHQILNPLHRRSRRLPRSLK